MSSLTINVQVAGSPPAGALANGTALAVSIYTASSFQLAPQRGQVPPVAATASGTTDGSGNVTLAGLSSVSYNLRVVDARGVNNWFFVNSAWPGSGTTFVATIPWSTPATTTFPIDPRGGDTIGTNAGQLAWAPFSHVHQVASSSGGGWTLITDSGNQSGNQSYTFSAIPQTYNHLMIYGEARSNAAAPDFLGIQTNGDTTTTDYHEQIVSAEQAAWTLNSSNTTITFREQASGDVAGYATVFRVEIPFYSENVFDKMLLVRALTYINGSPSDIYESFLGGILPQATITSIKLFNTSNNTFVTGTRFMLYGLT